MFEEQFMDSTRMQCLRQQLEKLWFKFPEIDQYIADFKDLANLSGYTVRNNKTINLFLKGFEHARDVLGGMLTPPIPIIYHALKDRAISITKSWQLMNAIQRGAPGAPGPLWTNGEVNKGITREHKETQHKPIGPLPIERDHASSVAKKDTSQETADPPGSTSLTS